MEKRTSKVSSRKIRGSTKPRASKRTTRAKQAKTRKGNRTHGRAPRTQHDRPAREVARPGRAGWHDRASWHGRARPGRCGAGRFRDFRPFYPGFCFIFWDLSSTFLKAFFTVELGSILASITSIRERLEWVRGLYTLYIKIGDSL